MKEMLSEALEKSFFNLNMNQKYMEIRRNNTDLFTSLVSQFGWV